MVKALQSCGRRYWGFLAVPQELAWPCKPSCHIPGERAAPLLTAMQDSSLSGCSGVSFLIKYICFVKLPKNNPGLVHAGGWQ